MWQIDVNVCTKKTIAGFEKIDDSVIQPVPGNISKEIVSVNQMQQPCILMHPSSEYLIFCSFFVQVH